MHITYIIMLGAALYHGFYGLRTILFELGFNKSIQRFINIFFWIVGISLFMLGSLATVATKVLEKVG